MSRVQLACFLLGLSFFAHAAPCDGVSVERARFAADIRDREPVGEPSGDLDALRFFTEIHGAAGRTLHHQWYWRGEQVAEVSLRIGGDRWRTWSSKILGARRDGTWQVEVRLDDGCLLGRYSPGAMPGDQAPARTRRESESRTSRGQSLAADAPRQDQESRRARDSAATIRGLLAQGDITGARLALAETDRLDSTRRERLMQEITLARIEKQVATDELYLAAARLDQLLRDSLSAETEQKALALKNRLDARRRDIDDRMAVALDIWEQSQRAATAGLFCAEDQETLQREVQLVDDSEHLMVNPPRREGDHVVAEVLDRRTGLMHRVSQYCPQWGRE